MNSREKFWKFLRLFRIIACAKRKFAHFTCWGQVFTFHLLVLHFSFAGCPKKCEKKVRIFHLQGVTLFACRGSEKMSKESSHFPLAKGLKKMPKGSSHFTLAGGHTFICRESEKNAKRKFALFTCRGSHFLLVKGLKKCQKSSHFSLAGVTFFTCRGSHFSPAGSPKKIIALNLLSTRTTNKACLGAARQNWNYLSTLSTNEPWLCGGSLWWADSLWIGLGGEPSLFSSARSAVHTSAPSRLSVLAWTHAQVYSWLYSSSWGVWIFQLVCLFLVYTSRGWWIWLFVDVFTVSIGVTIGWSFLA